MKEKIILGTSSPFRREMMELTGFEFTADSADIDEKFEGRPSDAEELVLLLSKLKAGAVAKKHENAIVIAFDSVGFFEGKILEKTKSYSKSFERLKELSGKKQEFVTGITVINTRTNKTYQGIEKSEIEYRELSDDEIKKYLDEDEKKMYEKTALGYDPVHKRAQSFIKFMKGDPNNIFGGFPVSKIIEMIKDAEGI